MAAKGLNYNSAICFIMWILYLLPWLPSMSCATTLQNGPQNQTSNHITSSPFQGPSIENTAYGAFSTDSGISVVTEARTCNTTLENGPKNKTRKAGERVSLTCDLKNVNNRRVLWRYVSETGIRRYISINEYSYDSDKYKIDIDEFFQKYKLVIKELTFPDDSGTYECGYDCESTESYIPLASAVVTVMQKFTPPSCRINLLPSLQSEADDGTFEIICFWARGYEGNAHFQNANGEDVQIHLTFPGRVITRINASKAPNITCHFMSNSSSEIWKAPCIGNKSTRMLRVDPFINTVTVNSNATFECSFSNHSYSYSGYWKIHYGANASLVRQENLIENQKVISIVNVSQSHQSILVECALNVSDNEKISSFGAIRIAKMTTTPPDENPTLWKTNNISKTTTDISEIKPTTITLLPESTSISVTSPRTSVATTTTDNSKSTRPTNVTRMLSEALSINVTSPLASMATTINDISESTRSNTATRMLSEATTITVTTPKKSVVTSPKIATPQRSDIPSCKIYTLPVVRSDYINRDYEIACSWNHSQAYQVQLQRSNDETIDNYLTFPDHIISRVNFSGDKSINCRLSFNSNTSTGEINIPCIEEDGLIRVDPFVVEVDEGSSALFTCSFNDRGRPYKLSWRVNSSGNLSAVDHDRTELNPNVKFAIYKQKDGEYLQVVCHFQLHGNNMSSYGLLRIIEGTTSNLTTPSGEGRTIQITDSQSIQTVKSTTNQNNITETRPQVKMTTTKLTASSEDGRTSQIEFTRDQSSTAQPTSPSKKGLVVMISISVLVAVVILLLSLAIVYLLRKQKRISLPRRLSEEDKTDTIELSNIPHILHEESSEWYALSFKDKRVQDIQEQQSNDLIVKHHDESDQNIPILSSSLGIPSLHLLESIDENVYAEPDVSEEPIRQTISRQQCTFTPLHEDEK